MPEQGHQRCRHKMQGIVIYKGIKRLKQYIDHCPECLRNNTRRHKPYGSLQPVINPSIPFHTLSIDFITGLPLNFDAVALMTYKFTKRLGAVPSETVWTSKDWALPVLVFLQSAD